MNSYSRLLVLALAVSALAGPARAGGFNLAWNDCGAFGATQKNFACDTNVGVNVLYVSAIPPAPMSQLVATAVAVDMVTNQSTLSPWWDLQTGGCRATAFSGNSSFVTGPFNCTDVWQGQASGGVNYTGPSVAPNRARLRGVYAVAVPVPADAIHELYLMSFQITDARTVGPGSCAGCTDGACLVLQSVQLSQPAGVGDFTLTTPLLSQYVTWQPGGGSVVGGCPGATPTRNATWGSVKALYR